MLIVSGHLIVDRRDAYLAGCAAVVEQARAAPGCLDFALSADLVDPDRINVYERWSDADALHAFRGAGPSGDQAAAIRSVSVRRYAVADESAP